MRKFVIWMFNLKWGSSLAAVLTALECLFAPGALSQRRSLGPLQTDAHGCQASVGQAPKQPISFEHPGRNRPLAKGARALGERPPTVLAAVFLRSKPAPQFRHSCIGHLLGPPDPEVMAQECGFANGGSRAASKLPRYEMIWATPDEPIHVEWDKPEQPELNPAFQRLFETGPRGPTHGSDHPNCACHLDPMFAE